MSNYALVVDNDGAWRDLLARAAERVGFRQESASTAGRAIELIKKRSYAIALVDPDLGTEQGPYGCTEILAEFKAKGEEVPTVIVSGLDDLQSLTHKLFLHYPTIREFSKAGSLLELENLMRDLVTISPPGQRISSPEDLSDLVEGMEYSFAFMKLDIVKHSEIYRLNRHPDIDDTLDAFEKFVEQEVKNCQGHILFWQGDGGLAIFFSGDKVANCGTAALSILYALPKFNNKSNKTDNDVRIRIGSHLGTAKYKSNHGRMHSAAVNFVSHLEAKATRTNAISISKPFYNELPKQMRKRFIPRAKFEGLKIYEHRLVTYRS